MKEIGMLIIFILIFIGFCFADEAATKFNLDQEKTLESSVPIFLESQVTEGLITLIPKLDSSADSTITITGLIPDSD